MEWIIIVPLYCWKLSFVRHPQKTVKPRSAKQNAKSLPNPESQPVMTTALFFETTISSVLHPLSHKRSRTAVIISNVVPASVPPMNNQINHTMPRIRKEKGSLWRTALTDCKNGPGVLTTDDILLENSVREHRYDVHFLLEHFLLLESTGLALWCDTKNVKPNTSVYWHWYLVPGGPVIRYQVPSSNNTLKPDETPMRMSVYH